MTNAIGTNAIGPSFGNELQVAGLSGLPFSWGADGSFEYDPSITQQQITAIQAVYAAHNPTTLQYAAAAAFALKDDDTTMHRIAEAVALGLNSWTNTDVVAWVNYRRTLRGILNGTLNEPVPAKPAYPAGT